MKELWEALMEFTDKVMNSIQQTVDYADSLHNDKNVKENSGK